MYPTETEAPANVMGIEARRQPLVKTGMEHLERLTADSDELVEHLQSAFGPVLFNQEGATVPDVGDPSIPGSDIGQALMRLTQRIDSNFRAIRSIVNAADV